MAKIQDTTVNMTQSTLSAKDIEIMRSAVARVAAGPQLSKDLSYDDTREVMRVILSGHADPVQSAVYFIGLRMKRETDDEFRAIMDATRSATQSVTLHAKHVVAMAEPYNGFNRTIPGSLFSLPILAACGVPAYSHGVEIVGPKFGVTHHTIMKALGANPLKSSQAVASQLDDKEVGWGYVDQQQFCPALHSLTNLRDRMIKRPAMSTTESMLCPIKGADGTHLVTGYVHKPYKDTYSMLARHCDFQSYLLIKGTEGGVVPSFRAPARVVRGIQDEHNDASNQIGYDHNEVEFNLEEINMLREYRALDIPESVTQSCVPGMKWDIAALADTCAQKGLAALGGESGPVQDAAIMAAALILWHRGLTNNMAQAIKLAKEPVASGEALARLNAAI